MSLARNPLSRRNLLALGGLAAAGVVSAACGSNTGRTPTDPGKVSLSQWYHQYGEAGTQQAAKKFAESYTEANVSMQWIPGEYDAKLASGLLTNDGPDVFEGHFNMQMARSGQVAPLDDIITEVKSDFSEVDIVANTWEGKVYGIRMIDDPQLLYYRKSMLDKAGIAPPTTFEELFEAAQKLTTKDVKGLFLGNNGGAGPLNRPVLFSTGQNFLTPDHKIGFASDKTIEALGKMRQINESKTLLLGAPTDWWDPSAFNQGLCAMAWNGLWAMPGIQKELGDDFGVLPFPTIIDGGKPAVYNGGWTQFVSAKSKNLEAAKQFVKWLWIEKTDFQEEWCLDYGFHIPPRKSLAAKATKLQGGQAAEAVKIASDYGVGDDPAWTSAMNTAYSDMVTAVVREGKDAAAELEVATKKVESELQKAFG